MRHIFKAFLVAFILITALPVFAADKEETAYERVMRTGALKVGYFVWPPYMIQDPNTGELSGQGFDHTTALSSLLGLKLEWVPMTGLGTQVEALKQGMYDIVANDGPYVFSTIKFIDFSDPLFYAPVYAYGRDDDNRFNSLDQLNAPEVTFVGLDGDLSVDLVQRLYPKAKLDTLPAATDPGMLMTNVRSKKGDITVIDPGSVITFNKNNQPGLKMISSVPVAVYPLGYSMMKDDGKLLTLINGAVAAMHNTNMVNPIIKKWMPEKNAVYPVVKPYEVQK